MSNEISKKTAERVAYDVINVSETNGTSKEHTKSGLLTGVRLICTNKAEVDAIYSAKQARSVHDVMRENYPDATFDGSRYHAPCDGYECELTGRTYRAGEFLPMSDEGDPGKACEVAATYNGELIVWRGSLAQIAATRAELVRQSRAKRAADNACSKHIGTKGDKLIAALTVDFIKAKMGYYGPVFLHILKDGAGNIIVYRGSKLLAGRRISMDAQDGRFNRIRIEGGIGETVNLSAKIKDHGEFESVKQTIIERPVLK